MSFFLFDFQLIFSYISNANLNFIMKQSTQTIEDKNTVSKVNKQDLVNLMNNKGLTNNEGTNYVIKNFKPNGVDADKKQPQSKSISALRNDISCYLFEYLDGFHIPTHFISKVSENEMMVKRLEMIPVVVKIYNIATESLTNRFGWKEKYSLLFPVIEYYYKNAQLDSAWLNEHHLYSFNIVTPEEYKQLNRLASKVNAVLRALCERRQLLLSELQLEFGKHKGQMVLGDELSPQTCHFIDQSAKDSLGQNKYQLKNENAGEVYTELCNRLKLKV
jgi:phosphoribosylaminoimidazole-succinocarboxamide synthase